MNKIYGFFNSKVPYGDAVGVAIAEDGEELSTHVSSSESWATQDIGGTHHHKFFDKKYPDGWEFEFVLIGKRDHHKEFQKALSLRHKKTAPTD